MTKQIEYFSDLRDQMTARLSADRGSALLSKSIFLISAGANDAFDFFSQNMSPDSTALQQFCEAVVSTYDSHVKVREQCLTNSFKLQVYVLFNSESKSFPGLLEFEQEP
jgi:hypothetical protein